VGHQERVRLWSLDWLVRVNDAPGEETHTRYNALGYRTVFTDATGSVTRYSYDGMNRLTAVEYVSDGVTVTYRYDALGRRTAMTDTLGATHYAYRCMGLSRGKWQVGI
jgi:YD repeat-containing protein